MVSTNRYQSFRHLITAALTFNLTSFYFGYCMVYFNAFDY